MYLTVLYLNKSSFPVKTFIYWCDSKSSAVMVIDTQTII